jgi:hypothetical protein
MQMKNTNRADSVDITSLRVRILYILYNIKYLYSFKLKIYNYYIFLIISTLLNIWLQIYIEKAWY